MIPDQIEREILIEAPVETVWRAVTEPDQLTRWFSEDARLDARPGGEGRLVFDPTETNPDGWDVRLSVVAVDPPRAFSYRWTHGPDEPATERNSMLVEFTLVPEGENTRLRLVESGLTGIDWDEARKRRYAGDHEQGWDWFLGRLRAHAAGQVPATR